MTRLTVQAHKDGKPVGEYVARSSSKNEQEMADWMHANRKEGIDLKFLGHYGVVTPTRART